MQSILEENVQGDRRSTESMTKLLKHRWSPRPLRIVVVVLNACYFRALGNHEGPGPWKITFSEILLSCDGDENFYVLVVARRSPGKLSPLGFMVVLRRKAFSSVWNFLVIDLHSSLLP